VSDYCLTSHDHFCSYIFGRICYIRYNNYDVHFALDQHA